ncbi:MAG: hypothetical protein OZSIB_1044 [Candidatus Ozemobacter sibiricus]|uniref:Peptidase M48 domain-containing protein n=1 Tax=Candidatus Ozemobacter sibiricus TaxID=2268124 RepID=A0A367ZLB3_9BACT|nr:MAG: hypothetical protein OZSIB_1044 [Candidatus Ozemobacter sibiricus]
MGWGKGRFASDLRRRAGRVLLAVLLLLASRALERPAIAESRNPLASYFSRLLDESRAETAIGLLLLSDFLKETDGASRTVQVPDLDALVERLAARTSRPTLPYRVVVIDSAVPGEIAFPGGPIILTSGLLALAATPEERAFLVARNLVHVALRHPMAAIKKEGLYAPILKNLKLSEERRDREAVRHVLRGFIKAATGMDQKKADREALALFDQPEAGRQAGLSLLRKLEKELWPIAPWEWFDLPGRIQSLESLAP